MQVYLIPFVEFEAVNVNIYYKETKVHYSL